MKSRCISYGATRPVEPRCNEVPRDLENKFVITGVRYIGVLFHAFCCSVGLRLIYRGLHYIGVRYIGVPPYYINGGRLSDI